MALMNVKSLDIPPPFSLKQGRKVLNINILTYHTLNNIIKRKKITGIGKKYFLNEARDN